MTQELITTDKQVAVDQAQPAAAYLAGLRTDVGRAGMRSELNKVARIMGASDWLAVDWRTLNAANVLAIMGQIEGAPATRKKTLAALKGVATSAWRLGLMDSDTLAKIRDVKGDKGTREPKGREIQGWEIDKLMRTCAADETPAGARDAALLAVAYQTGGRRAELAAMQIGDLKRSTDSGEISVIGKGGKQRMLYPSNGALDALDDWLTVRGKAPSALFCAISQTGVIEPEHEITTTALHKILQKRAAEAELTDITWHDFRRSFAGNMLNAGVDIVVVKALMGHADVETTARYDRRPAETRRQAARKISVPYYGRK